MSDLTQREKMYSRLALIAIITGVLSVAWSFTEAYSDYQVTKPLMAFIEYRGEAVPPVLKMLSRTFQYDPASNRYLAIVFEVINMGETNLGAEATILIFDSNYNQIASGTGRSGLLQPEAKDTFSVQIEWVPGASVLDYTSDQITIQAFIGEG